MKPPPVTAEAPLATTGARPAVIPHSGRAVDQLVDTYRVIAEWLLYPESIDPALLTDAFVDEACEKAAAVDPAIPGHLREFRAQFESIDLEEYLGLLELSPRCPLYLGSYQFQEPSTCASAGVSDRNQYMLEMGNIFRHFGLLVHDDLPDFLPVVVEFLALTAGAEGEDAELRSRFIERMVWDGVRLFAKRLEMEETHYQHLAQALTLCLRHEVGDLPEPDPEPTDQGTKSELIQLEGVADSE